MIHERNDTASLPILVRSVGCLCSLVRRVRPATPCALSTGKESRFPAPAAAEQRIWHVVGLLPVTSSPHLVRNQ
jgi:hypothetical protein